MLLKFGILSIVLFTFQISESLANPQQCDNVASIEMCLGNKTLEVQVSANNLTCQASEVFRPNVRDDYVHTPGVGYHKFHTEGKPWNQARKICMGEGGHLAVINSQVEHQVLLDIFKKEEKNIKAEFAGRWSWLGGHNLYDNGDWVTVFGEPLLSTGFDKWAPGEPTGNNEHCLCLYSKEGTGLNDGGCYSSLPFFCEISDACP